VRGDNVSYSQLQTLVLPSNLTARDIDVIQYNATQAKIALYCTLLNHNIEALKEEIAALQEIPSLHIGTDEPTDDRILYWAKITQLP
jgi:hypothetical protein